jgi:hypothetical protein
MFLQNGLGKRSKDLLVRRSKLPYCKRPRRHQPPVHRQRPRGSRASLGLPTQQGAASGKGPAGLSDFARARTPEGTKYGRRGQPLFCSAGICAARGSQTEVLKIARTKSQQIFITLLLSRHPIREWQPFQLFARFFR